MQQACLQVAWPSSGACQAFTPPASVGRPFSCRASSRGPQCGLATISPFLPSSQIRARLSSRSCFSVNFFNNSDAFSGQNRTVSRVRCARASVDEDDRKESQTFPPPGELQYFGKLSASCVAGAVLVKYGSICVPSVTSPNLNVALVMIVMPCLLSVALLTLASIFSSDGNARKQ